MCSAHIRSACNWDLPCGWDLSDTVQTNTKHNDDLTRPLDEIFTKDHAVLLHQPLDMETDSACELQITVDPHQKIESLHMVCSVGKVELLLGQQKEYTSMTYGKRLTDETIAGGDEESSDCIQFYRYDMEIDKSGIVDVTLKLLTMDKEIFLYGIVVNIAPNPNGITTLQTNVINVDNVQRLLSTNTDRFKAFMQAYKRPSYPSNGGNGNGNGNSDRDNPLPSQPPTWTQLTQMLNHHHSLGDDRPTVDLATDLKRYMDERLQQLETRLTAQIYKQTEMLSMKLDKLLILQVVSKSTGGGGEE